MANSRILARLGAIVLAASMVFADAAPTLAAENGNVSANQDVKGSVKGVSKVIGLKGQGYTYNSMTINGVEKDFVYLNNNSNYVYVMGKKDDFKDAATGLYKYDGKYYGYAYEDSNGEVELYDEVVNPVFISSELTWEEQNALRPKEDPATGMYKVNDKLYYWYSTRSVYDANDKYLGTTYYFYKSNEVAVYEIAAADVDVYAVYGQKANPTDTYARYYTIKGRNFTSIDWEYVYDENTGNKTGKIVFGYANSEISFDKKYHLINWQTVTNETEFEYKGKVARVGYQVKVDGELAKLDYVAKNNETFSVYGSYTNRKAFAAGEKAKYEVRAVYYTTTETITKDADGYEKYSTTYDIVKTGEWSDAFTFAWKKATATVPTVKGLKATASKNTKETIELTWNKVDVASGYRIQRIRSVEPITDWSKVTDSDWSSVTTTSATKYSVNNRSLGGYYVYDEYDNETYVEYNYAYYRVAAYVNYDQDKYVSTTGEYCSPVTVTKAAKVANTPAIKNLTVENKLDGSFTLKWDDIDDNAEVVVFYSDDKSVFSSKEYTYDVVNARGKKANGNTVYLTDTYALQDKLTILNRKLRTSYLGAGTTSFSPSGLEPGKKYYFVVATYDDINANTDRSATTPYKANVARVQGETENVAFGFYNDIVTSKTVSGKITLSVGEPTIKSEKTSVTMSFDKYGYTTGYEILRKSGSKYKKIATINSNKFVDENLKENTTYDYKVRAYYYNPATKATVYSDYVFFAAETSTNNYISLNAVQASKTSAKLKWTKVAGAVKYEVYRSNTYSIDDQYSKKNGLGNGKNALGNDKWELIKTINKASTVTYTDKKLTANDYYAYRVVATYKSGNKTKQIFATDGVSFAATNPSDVKTSISKNNVKVTWEKNYYASKYEVSYIIYDADGIAKTTDYVVAKPTTKTNYTIKSVPAGGHVYVRVRTYANKKWSGYSGTYEYNDSLPAVKGVAAKETSDKAVKVSWKKVSGAAYYRVYRSTSPVAGYDKDLKVYHAPDENTWRVIAKEANTDENYSIVPYTEYKGWENTVVGTSAVDRTKLDSGVTYYYYVMAYSKDGQKISDGYNTAASICYGVTPSVTVKAAKGKTTVKIGKVTGAKKYIVYRSTKQKSGYTQVGTTTKTTYTDKTTKKGKTYYYKVVAVGTNALKADFESAESKAVKVKAK